MPVIGICNQKGGSGKSSTAVHLARWLQSQSDSILVVDSDGQRTSSLWLNALSSPIPYEIIPEPDRLLERLPDLAGRYQWTIVDAPGTLAEASRAIVLWSDFVLIPCQPTGVDLASTSDTIRLIGQARAIRKGEPRAAIFLNRAIKGTRLKQEAFSVLKAIPNIDVLSEVIHQRQIIADAFGQSATVFDLAGDAAQDAQKEYGRLFNSMVGLLG
ncbi:AAA family ATPase [Chamaesiphon minutus]|uniref:ATPase involved in chromosome partitioning n=1 Tax=Chamaesiphon minutus (strain ATCC 27169 / PCC 6605) TaxID=1173020 RepID=K9UE45_CHAP6|nr:AAA family ATPase [Chamaesiphon minutus]AFY93105.1 ATPase involved in chromosome partitioning [Chamaesiphon minutus PCC 6605]